VDARRGVLLRHVRPGVRRPDRLGHRPGGKDHPVGLHGMRWRSRDRALLRRSERADRSSGHSSRARRCRASVHPRRRAVARAGRA
jgi:hypothetical protein